jgi:hypothetical protein
MIQDRHRLYVTPTIKRYGLVEEITKFNGGTGSGDWFASNVPEKLHGYLGIERGCQEDWLSQQFCTGS